MIHKPAHKSEHDHRNVERLFRFAAQLEIDFAPAGPREPNRFARDMIACSQPQRGHEAKQQILFPAFAFRGQVGKQFKNEQRRQDHQPPMARRGDGPIFPAYMEMHCSREADQETEPMPETLASPGIRRISCEARP